MADETTPPPKTRRPHGSGAPHIGERAYSPVCTYCYWWKPADGHYCGAWPPGGSMRIPDTIWNGQNSHMYPVGSEKKDAHGQPIVFRLHPDANKANLPERLAHDLAERENREPKEAE